MKNSEFEQHLKVSAGRHLWALLEACRARYIEAARLVSPDASLIREFESDDWRARIDVSLLIPVVVAITRRYARETYDPQLEFMVNPEVCQDQDWSRYLHWQLIPQMTESSEFVRNVLRSVRLLPSTSAQAAANSALQFVNDMPLPAESDIRRHRVLTQNGGLSAEHFAKMCALEYLFDQFRGTVKLKRLEDELFFPPDVPENAFVFSIEREDDEPHVGGDEIIVVDAVNRTICFHDIYGE